MEVEDKRPVGRPKSKVVEEDMRKLRECFTQHPFQYLHDLP